MENPLPASQQSPETSPSPVERRSRWLCILKWLCLALLGLFLLAGAAIGTALLYLTPERLTPIVCREASRYLDADVRAGRVEISFYSTFPRFELDIQNLSVRSKALDTLPDSVSGRLPVWADSLLSFDRLQAGVNIPKLLTGAVELYDITLSHPVANIVQAAPGLSSADIFPPSGEEADTASTPLPVTGISLSTFRITDGMTVRYLSLPDTIDAEATLGMAFSGTDAPLYRLDIEGRTSLKMSHIAISNLGLGLGGVLRWSPSAPRSLSAESMELSAGRVRASLSGDFVFGDSLSVSRLEFTLPRVPVSDIVSLIPAGMRGELSRLDPRFDIALEARLNEPYTVGAGALPSFTAHVSVPDGSAVYDTMRLQKIQLDAEAKVDGKDLDRSVLSVANLRLHGVGLGFVLSGRVTEPLSDPHIEGVFKGGISFGHLSPRALALIPGTVRGMFKADASFDLRRSWIAKDSFHRIRLVGTASLDGLDLSVPSIPIDLSSRRIELRFGSSQSFVSTGATVDSLLTASLRIDTISADLQGMELRGSDLAVGVGCRNVASSTDTTVVNPVGARVMAGRLFFRSPSDSLLVSTRKAGISLSLTRYKGYGRLPQVSASVEAERAFFASHTTRAMLSDARMALGVHPKMSASNIRRLRALDSLSRANPGVSRDSLERLYAAGRTRRHQGQDSASVRAAGSADLAVDSSLRRLLRRWDASGTLSAARVSAFTPLFPLRSRITGLDLAFSTDSVVIRDTRVRVGESDFTIDGTVSDLDRALTSRRGRVPVKVRLTLASDTINVNQIASAAFAGSAFAQAHPGGIAELTEGDADTFSEETLSRIERETATDSASLFVVPANVDASLDVRAANIIYSDLIFHSFHGRLNCLGGALNLDRMGASTDVGSLLLNALYTAEPDASKANFAFGLQIAEFNIREFLDLVPAVDSMMPLLNSLGGIVSAGLAATADVDRDMNIDIPSLKAAVRISGNSLKVIDDETFRTIGKWLMFKQKERNVIDSMTVEAVIDNSQLRLFPFIFNMDRYRLGVSGHNDMALNLDYHVAVLKSPLPFRFGINIKGTPDDMKIRVGKARLDEHSVAGTVQIADTTRVNLVRQISNIFRRGVKREEMKALDFARVSETLVADQAADLPADTISHADSLVLIREGIIEMPDSLKANPAPAPKSKKSKRKK